MRSAITATGMGLGVLGDQIGGAPRGEGVDPLMRQAFDAGRQAFDPPRDEGAIDEIAQPRVLGRLELQHRVALERVERLKMRFRCARLRFGGRAAEAAVAQQSRHVGEAREAPEAVILPEERGRGLADRRVGRIGIVEEIGVARVEAHAPPGDVDRKRHGGPSKAFRPSRKWAARGTEGRSLRGGEGGALGLAVILPAPLNVFSELRPRLVPPSKLARLREGAPGRRRGY